MSVSRSTLVTRLLAAKTHIIHIFPGLAETFISPGFAIFLLVVAATVALFARLQRNNVNVTSDESPHAGVTPHLGAVDVHVLRIVAALAAGGPVRAVHVVVLALVAALLARHRAVRQHPARVLNTSLHSDRKYFLTDGKYF